MLVGALPLPLVVLAALFVPGVEVQGLWGYALTSVCAYAGALLVLLPPAFVVGRRRRHQRERAGATQP